MLSKILQTLILINLASKALTTTINCSFENISIPLGRLDIIQGYGCNILSLTNEESQNSIKFNGTHDNNKTDDDVTIVKYQIDDKYQLPQFESSFCEKFSNIETIFISQLEILSVDQDSLRNCQKLSKLYFYGNKIREFPANLLTENLKLTVLNLDFNFLTELPDNFLKNQKGLEELSLTNNQLITFSSNFFDSLTNLNILGLGSNKISEIDPKWFKKLENLVSLGLERNEITEIPSNTFSSIRYLVELNLSSNKITTLNSNSFSGLNGLKTLNLDHNEIKDLPENLFSDTELLEELSIGHNKLSIIHEASFGNLPNLATLHLHFNEIDGFDERLINSTAVHDLDLTENLCYDGWILIWDRIRTNLAECFQKYILLEYSLEDVDAEDATPSIHSTETTTIQTIPHRTTIKTTEHDSIIKTTTEISNNSNHTDTFDIRANLEDDKVVKRQSCGKPKLGIQTIMRGTAISKGSYPWNVALYADAKYICGGTVVSSKTVVTAAHCFKGKRDSHLYTAAQIIVTIGAHNLSQTIEIGRQTFAVRKITIHPDWNHNVASYDADIAILELDQEITFSNYIQPICLMNPGSNMEYIEKGIVAGFGKSESNDVEHVARVIDMPIHSYANCSKSGEHQQLLSSRTFCGGHANGTGVCVGDSGSGLHVVYKNTYYLRGIVSASLNGDLHGCNVHAYAVFTDAVKHIAFIETGKVDGKTSSQKLEDKFFELGYSSKDFQNPEIWKRFKDVLQDFRS